MKLSDGSFAPALSDTLPYGDGAKEQRLALMHRTLKDAGRRDALIYLSERGDDATYRKVAHVSDAGFVYLFFGYVAEQPKNDVFRMVSLTPWELENLLQSATLQAARDVATMRSVSHARAQRGDNPWCGTPAPDGSAPYNADGLFDLDAFVPCADCGGPDSGTGFCAVCDAKPENAACGNCGALLRDHPFPGTCDTPSLTRSDAFTLT